MESRQEVEHPRIMDQLAEQHQVGQPLALYNIHPQWKRTINLINRFSLIITVCAVLFVLVVFSIFFYQVIENQIVDVQGRLLMSLPGTIVGLLGCGQLMFARYMITQWLPISCLVCTEGLLVISRKKVEVTHWNEVRGFLEVPGSGKRKSYRLYRINRKLLTFSNIYEDTDGLADLVRQHAPQHWNSVSR
jgi:hypothetical protein